MKRILQRGKHLWRAKGRHGTHSPFVYAFVEQVMRRKIRFPIDKSQSTILTQQQINLTGRTIQYLKPEVVYVDAILFNAINELSRNIKETKFKLLPADFTNGALEINACFVCLPTKENINFLRGIAAQHVCQAIIPLNCKDAEAMQYWNSFNEDAIFKMVLNAWHIGFVSNHSDFKTKQYFRLR